MEALALIICIGVVIYGLAYHKNETIIISCVLVCVLGVHSLFSLTRTPIETTEIVNEEGEEVESEKTEEKPVEFTRCLQTDSGKWYESNYSTSQYSIIVHLGKGVAYGFSELDLFCAKENESSYPVLFLGHLNSGKY